MSSEKYKPGQRLGFFQKIDPKSRNLVLAITLSNFIFPDLNELINSTSDETIPTYQIKLVIYNKSTNK